jgi:2-polyprenyl-6-methoxyphenol hydroxylase-like FAD-dependent oxidoreductase
MPEIGKVLVVGGGIAGMSLGIGLRRAGIRADIVEVNPEWTVLGLGIALLGPTLRALRTIGLLDRCIAEGFGYSSFAVGNPAGKIVQTVDLPRLNGPDYPAAVGIMRPAFHRALGDACREEGVAVRLGVTVESLRQTANAVEVAFTDGSTDAFDLVVAADGAHSKVRELVFGPDVRPRYTGQTVWRATVERPPEVTSLHVYYGGKGQPGFNPVSPNEMYVFLVQNSPENVRIPPEQLPGTLREQLAGFGGLLADARERITQPEKIVHRPIDALLVPPPWHRGRVLLIGDAAHVPTPHLASGAGIAIEDAIVLVELLRSDAPLADVLTKFMARRYERCRMVVENSVQFGEWEKHPGMPGADPAGLLARSMAALAQPI